jgi:uncharacterized membrane protein
MGCSVLKPRLALRAWLLGVTVFDVVVLPIGLQLLKQAFAVVYHFVRLGV